MSRNRNQLLFYRSQATITRNQNQHSGKLYGSGAVMASQTRSPNKNIQEVQLPHRDCQSNQPSDIYQKGVRQLERANHTRQPLLRSRSGDHVSWNSPSKLPNGDNFKSIIEEINEQNDRNFSQLDTDLKRIKSNLTRIEQQGSEAKMSSHNQALLEEVEILQQQNDRLREKNVALIAEKKKMAKEIEEYESLLQREKVKQIVGRNQVEVKEDGVGVRKMKIELEEKISECEKMKLVNTQLLSSKASWEKREGLMGEEKNKLVCRIAELQREKDRLQISLQEDLKRQMEKKDSHYCKLLKTQQAKYEQVIAKLKNNLLKSNQMEKEFVATQTKEQLEKLKLQQSRMSDTISIIKSEKAKIQNQKEQLEMKMDAMNNQLQLLGFSYRELSDNAIEKDFITAELKKKCASISEDLKRKRQQIEGVRLKGEEETKRVHYLQQLCNKLQRQLQLKEIENQRTVSQLNRALAISQKQTQKYQVAFESVRKERLVVEEEIKQACKDKEKYIIELKKKAEEFILLKKENIVLVQKTKSLRLNLSPDKPEKEANVEEKVEQRLHSARDLRDGQAKYSRDMEQVRVKKIQKELTDLMHQCRLQSQKTKSYYKERELKLQDSNKNQQKRIDELADKLERTERQLRGKIQELSQQEQSARQLSRKKQTEFFQEQRKSSQLMIKNKTLEQQLQIMKKKMSEFISKRYEERIKEGEQKISSLREQFKKIITAISSQISNLQQSTSNRNPKMKGLQISCRQFKSLEDIQKIAELTYSIYALSSYVKSLHNKIKETTASKQLENNNQSCLLERSQSTAEDHFKCAQGQRKREKAAKIIEESHDYENGMNRNTELERKYQRQLVEQRERVQQIQGLNDQIRIQRRQINRLKQQLEQSEEEKDGLKAKYRIAQEKQVKKQSQKAEKIAPQKEYPSFEYLTPVKEYGSMRQTAIEEDFERKMRSRIRSARSCEKRDDPIHNEYRELERKLLSYQSNLSKLHRDLEEKTQKLQKMQIARDQAMERERRLKSKYEEAMDNLELMENQLQKQSRQKSRLQSKNKEIQYQMGIITEEKSKIQAKMQQNISQFHYDKQKREKQMKQTLLQKQLLQKRLKRDLQEKQERLIGVIQQYELKLIDMNSQMNRCNESINQLTIKLTSSCSLNEQYSTRLSKKEQKLIQHEQLIRQSKQRLQRQQRERQSLVAKFSNNTTRLTKIIEEKQIEIEQLKFIQETTLINLQFARSQQHRRSPSESAYSFKNDF